jgi:phosphoglycerate dehydrogenase-like enzyme
VRVAAHFGGFDELMVPLLASAAPDVELVAAGTPGADVLVTLLHDRPDAAAMLDGVRWVHVLGAGVDGFPMDVVGDRLLTCSRGASAPAIAEFVLAAMLAFEKQVPEVWIREPPARWNVAALGGLRGRTVGIVGLGAIGTEVARRALAFDMQVLGLRRRADAGSPVEGVEVVTSLPDLLARSHHVVVAAAATEATRHLLDRDAFASMTPGAHLVNVARGSLVDQDALLRALDEGRVARASLDVVEPEPLPAGHQLYAHPNVRLTPHVSWSSPDTTRRTVELFAENLRRWRAGESLHGLVDVGAGY